VDWLGMGLRAPTAGPRRGVGPREKGKKARPREKELVPGSLGFKIVFLFLDLTLYSNLFRIQMNLKLKHSIKSK
jgi:hypothetical protein